MVHFNGAMDIMNTDFVIYNGRTDTIGILQIGEEKISNQPLKGFILKEQEEVTYLEKVIISMKTVGQMVYPASAKGDVMSSLSTFQDQVLCRGMKEATVLLKLATLASPKFMIALLQVDKVQDNFVYRSRQCKTCLLYTSDAADE